MSDQVHVVAGETVNDKTVNDEQVNSPANATQENQPTAVAAHPEAPTESVSADAPEQPQAEGVSETPEAVVPEGGEAEVVVETHELVAPEVVEAVQRVEQVEEPQAEVEVEAPEAVAPEAAGAEPVVEPVTGAAVSAEAAEEPQAAAEPVEEGDVESTEVETRGQDGKRVVRVLSVGQEISGTVKRIAEFGAFIDIGVGRDGLIHISELSSRRVGKVTDVLQEGQEITAWIKKLDRDRNRISLTLIDPGTKTIRDLNKGDIVHGTVTRIMPYGAFIDIGIGRDALLHVREMAQGYVGKPEDVVKVGETVEARVVDLSRRRNRVDLSLKGLRPEPEPEIPAAPQAAAEPEPEPVEEEAPDPYDEIEVLSPMQLAFKRAVEAEGGEIRDMKGKRGKQKSRNRSIQDEIIARTLESGRK